MSIPINIVVSDGVEVVVQTGPSLDDIATAVDSKADKEDVNDKLATKADTSYLDTQIGSVLSDNAVQKASLQSLQNVVLGSSGTYLTNTNITVNNTGFSVDNVAHQLMATSSAATYKWVLFDTIDNPVQFTCTTADVWLVVKGNATNSVAITLNGALTPGLTRKFTSSGRTDLIAGNAALAKAGAGDVVQVSAVKDVYTIKIKRLGAADFVSWFVIDLTGLVTDTTIVQKFGILQVGNTTGVVVTELIKKSGQTSLSGKLETLQADYEQYKAAGSVIPANEVDLVMFMGQSNMAGRGTAAQAPIVPNTAGYEFRAISDPTKLYQIVEPFGVNENNASGITEPGMKTGGMVSAFVNTYYGLVGRKIVGVSASKGGSSITLWQPNGAYLNDAIARFNAAKTWLLANGYTIKNKFMVWCQGETDGDNAMPGATYTTNLKAMIDAMITAGLDRCYIVRIGNHRDNATLYDPIISAQTELCKTYPTATLVSTKLAGFAAAGLMVDVAHYVQSAYNTAGEEVGTHVAFHIRNKKEPTMYDGENNNLYFSYK